MNELLKKITDTIQNVIRENLTDIPVTELEENGTVYYMNGRNGTEFDWYVNDRLSDFMVFYNDERKMGAVKACVYRNGDIRIYVYGDRGARVLREITDVKLDGTQEELLRLAVLLWRTEPLPWNPEKKDGTFDAAVEQLNTDREPKPEWIEEFLSHETLFEPTIRRMKLLSLRAYVSKKITDEGWRIGYMFREEPDRETASGWIFYAGNEDDDYLEDWHNIALLSVGSVWQLDPAVWNYLDSPIGTELIRVSDNQFEPDDRTKPMQPKLREQ